MCYFTNDFIGEIALRENLQQDIINGNLNLDFYSRLKQLNLLNTNRKFNNDLVDAEANLRNITASFLILLNLDAFIKVKINKSKYSYLLNEFLFELTLCENICNCIKNSHNKAIYLKAKFNRRGFIVTIIYKGKKITPRNYSNLATASVYGNLFYNTVKIEYNCQSSAKEKPPKINLDGYIKNRLSSVYITLYLSGLKRFN